VQQLPGPDESDRVSPYVRASAATASDFDHGAPLLQADHSGDAVYLAFGSAPGGPVAEWLASAPNSFTVSTAKDFSTDLTAASDGTMFAIRSGGTTEIRGANLTLAALPTSAELETIANRIAVPGAALHPSGALLYEPFLDGAPPPAPPATGIRGGVDIRDAHSGRLRCACICRNRLRCFRPIRMACTGLS